VLKTPPERPRRLVYLGTPTAAVPPLVALHGAGFEIALVVSRADKRRGRGAALLPSPVKAAAIDLGLSVTDRLADALGVGADLGVVVAYGRIIPVDVLEALPMVNLHFSLLPRWRGAAPVERALLAGDRSTGVCVMAVEEGLDTGGVYRREELAIDHGETLEHLRGRLVDAGSRLLVDALSDGLGPAVPQRGEATYANKITPDELRLDWVRPADELARVVALGGAWTTFRGRRLKVWSVAPIPEPTPPPGALDGVVVGTGSGGLELVEVQPEGKGRIPAGAWRNGAHPAPGELLGS